MLKSEFDERVRALQIQFLAYSGAVIFNRARADTELGGDFLQPDDRQIERTAAQA